MRAEGQNVVPLRARPSAAVSVAAALAVAASAAVVALGLSAASLHHSLAGDRSALRVLGDPRARHIPLTGVRGALVVAPSGDAALTADLPALPKGKVYEAWVIDANSVRRAGTFTGDRTTLTTQVPSGATVKVTVERAGGCRRTDLAAVAQRASLIDHDARFVSRRMRRQTRPRSSPVRTREHVRRAYVFLSSNVRMIHAVRVERYKATW